MATKSKNVSRILSIAENNQDPEVTKVPGRLVLSTAVKSIFLDSTDVAEHCYGPGTENQLKWKKLSIE